MPRTPQIYNTVLDQLNVETNPKYQPKNGTTFCNIFAQDVMNHKLINAPLPVGLCSTLLFLLEKGKVDYWLPVAFDEAQTRANTGNPSIAMTDDHIVIVRPNIENVTSIQKVLVAQAGRSCFNKKTINWSFVQADLLKVKFFSFHDKSI